MVRCFHQKLFYWFTRTLQAGSVTIMQGYGGNKGRDRWRWPTLVLVCAAEFVVVGALTVVAIALPSIEEDLGFSQSGLQWVISAYVLAFGGFLLPAGRAADLWGRRRVFIVGLALFSGASLVCGLSGSESLLVAARAMQGLGAAIVTPAALSILTDAFPEGRERSRAVGFWTAAQAGGGASGWIVGGFLTQGLGWEWVFLATAPIGALGVLLAPLLLPESSDPSAPPKLDAAGATTVTVALALLVYGLTRAGEAGPASLSALGPLGLSVALVALFFLIEGRVRHPLVPLGVFRSRNLVGSGLVALAFQATTNAPLLLCILYLQEVVGLPPAEAGFAFVPFNLAVVGGSFLGSRFTGGIGTRLTAACGLSTIAFGVLLLARITPESGYPSILLPGFVLMGLGVGLSAVASTTAGTSALGDEKQGLASGLLNASAEVGYVLGLAVLVPLSAARTDSLAEGIAHPPDAALVDGFRWAFYAGATLAVLVAVIALRLIRAKAAGDRESHAPDKSNH
jgi:EmrB/QacA subfamily drug resistance transporter